MPPHDKPGRHNTTGANVWPVPLLSSSKKKRPKQDMYIIYDTMHSWSTNPGSVASQATTPAAGIRCVPNLHFEYDKPCAPCPSTFSESSELSLLPPLLSGGGSKFELNQKQTFARAHGECRIEFPGVAIYDGFVEASCGIHVRPGWIVEKAAANHHGPSREPICKSSRACQYPGALKAEGD